MDTELLPLFPLSTVLYPGAPLPLHVFEERYREMVRDLVSNSDRRWFGVVAVRHGSEVGESAPSLYDVGCIAVVRRVDAYPDGRFDIVTAGGPRFRISELDQSRSYLRATVGLLDEEYGDRAEDGAVAARAALAAYWEVLCGIRGERIAMAPVADDPLELSYLASTVLQLDVAEKQALLECRNAAERIAAATSLLRREAGLLTHLAAAPRGDELGAAPVSLN